MVRPFIAAFIFLAAPASAQVQSTDAPNRASPFSNVAPMTEPTGPNFGQTPCIFGSQTACTSPMGGEAVDRTLSGRQCERLLRRAAEVATLRQGADYNFCLSNYGHLRSDIPPPG